MDQEHLDSFYRSAASNGELDAVKEYLHNGADINSKTESNYSAIAMAAHAGHTDVVAFLVTQEGIDLEIADTDGSALFNAIKANKYECAKILLEAGANVNARYPGSQQTPLMYVLYNEYSMKWCELILSHDPDLTITHDGGKDAYYYCNDTEKGMLDDYILNKSTDKVSYITSVGSRVIQDIFDFSKHEKTTMVRQNKYGAVEAVTCDDFDHVSRKYLRKAFNEHVRRGGKTKASDIGLIDELDKSKIQPALKFKKGG